MVDGDGSFSDGDEGLMAGLSVYEREAWYDLDDPEDLTLIKEEPWVRPDLAPRKS